MSPRLLRPASEAVNLFERALIEKAGREHGWENVLECRDDLVLVASARHRGRASITEIGGNRGWHVELPGGRLARELDRTMPGSMEADGRFRAPDMDGLVALLRRAAELSQSLPDQAAINFREQLKKTLATLPAGGTEVERLVRQRVGQDVFRQALMDYWGGACAVTGLSLPELLRASHAKPWADCATDEERLDVFNGFLLVANLDGLFDRALISFDVDGMLLISPRLTSEQRKHLSLAASIKLRWVAEEHRPYLAWHREHLFGS